MNYFVVVLFAVALAAPQEDDKKDKPVDPQLGVLSCDMKDKVDLKCLDPLKKAECTQCVMNEIRIKCQQQSLPGHQQIPGQPQVPGQLKQVSNELPEASV
jgi:hypothetical protein